MNIAEFAAAIGLAPRIISALDSVEISAERAAQLKELFISDFNSFAEEARKENDANMVVLKLYLEWAQDTRACYAKLGIPESIFFDNMKDINIWTEDHYTKTGKNGFTDWGWVALSLKMEVIRLGRLQFQPVTCSRDIAAGGITIANGEKMLAVHIPAGEPLSPEKVRASFEQAPGFFKKYFGVDYRVYHCHSWLLSPALHDLLKEGSAILEFQKNFCIFESDPSRQAEERVFGVISDDFAGYPEKTSLQRSLKAHLLSGKTVPAGAGVGRFSANELDDDDLDDVTGGSTEQTTPGFTCPACGAFIATAIDEILVKNSIKCPTCNHVYSLDKQKFEL